MADWFCPNCRQSSTVEAVRYTTAAKLGKAPDPTKHQLGSPSVCPQCGATVIPIPDPDPPSSRPGKGQPSVQLFPVTGNLEDELITLAVFSDDQDFVATTSGKVFVKIKTPGSKRLGSWQYGDAIRTVEQAEAIVRAAADKLGGSLIRFTDK